MDATSKAPEIVTAIELVESRHSSISRNFTGVLQPRRASDLGFNRAGFLKSVHVDEGDAVHEGQLIARLDTDNLQAETAVLQAQLAVANAVLSERIAGPRVQTIQAAQARVNELKALHEQAESMYRRRRQLSGSDAISEQDIEDSQHQVVAAANRFNAQRENLQELIEGTRKEQIEAQRAEVRRIEALIQQQLVQISESEIKAPYDGIISRLNQDAGAIVTPGSMIARIVDTQLPEAWIGIHSELASKLQRGIEYRFSVQGESRVGKLRSVLPELDATTRTQTAVFSLSPREHNGSATPLHLASDPLGLMVQFHFEQEIEQAGFWLPLSSLLKGANGLWQVMVVESTGSEITVKMRPVEVVQIDSSRVLVRGPLSAGDQVVQSGLQKLTDGQRVQLAPSTSL